MDPLACQQCGAELLPQTSFCRQCGWAIAPSEPAEVGERPTKLFDEVDVAVTNRLDPRPTSPKRSRLNSPLQDPTETPKRSSRKFVLVGMVIVLLLLAVFSTLALLRTNRRAASAEGLTYPGARKTMEVIDEGGGRALQLNTDEPFEKVQAWYIETMKPEKVIHLSHESIVIKNDKATATIVSEGNKTNILLKLVP